MLPRYGDAKLLRKSSWWTSSDLIEELLYQARRRSTMKILRSRLGIPISRLAYHNSRLHRSRPQTSRGPLVSSLATY